MGVIALVQNLGEVEVVALRAVMVCTGMLIFASPRGAVTRNVHFTPPSKVDLDKTKGDVLIRVKVNATGDCLVLGKDVPRRSVNENGQRHFET